MAPPIRPQEPRLMTHRHAISDADFARIENLLPGQPGQHGGVARDNRRFLDAVLWIARTGAAWRDLPERLGPWNSQWRRFDRWAKAGRFAALAAVLQDPELDVLILDSTAVRAHPCAAGAKKMGRDWRPGRSGAWSQPRRVRHEDPRRVRRPRAPPRVAPDGGSGVGHRPGRGVVGRPHARSGDRGQGVRQEG